MQSVPRTTFPNEKPIPSRADASDMNEASKAVCLRHRLPAAAVQLPIRFPEMGYTYRWRKVTLVW